jgi:hypothetical protein
MNAPDTGFNLDAIDSQPVTFNVGVIVDADGNDKTGFTIVGKDSPEYQEAARQIRAVGIKRSAKRKSALDLSTDEGAASVAKNIDDNELQLASSVLKDWFGFARAGAVVPFDKAVAVSLLVKYPTWREKIAAALEVDSNFTKG